MSKNTEVAIPQPNAPKEKKGPDKWEIEDAAKTLLRAEEIKANKELMPHVHKHLTKQKKAIITSIDELRAKGHERRMELAHGEDEKNED